MININGVAHIMLTVSNYPLCRAFYEEFLPFLGLKPITQTDDLLYYVGSRTAVGIKPSSAQFKGERFVQDRVGLHHICFRARSREDVDAVHTFVLSKNRKIIRTPEEGDWATGYYSTLFEDPDGIRIEVNFVPGKGLLEITS